MMYSVPPKIQPTTPALLAPLQMDSRQLYFAMLDEGSGIVGQIDELSGSTSRSFLQEQLSIAAATHSDFPATMLSLPAVLRSAQDQVAQEYRRYLDERSAGSPRRYFGCRSHAMYFLRTVAPTKLVDGAWLYGLLQSWQDPRLTPLIRTYLEELGCGNLQQNHVLIYKRLLARYGCEKWQDGPTAHFTQGAVQLALAHHADEFLPELIGFNLGYEQLPLHLLITAYELNELDIDPYYFTLHVSIDNASTGHARLALQSLQDCTPRLGDAKEFYRRVGNGYRLNQVGMGTQQVIASFDLEQELLRVLSDKAKIGAKLHSDYCLVGGRRLSEWLSSSAEMADLLKTLQSTGWIRRGESLEQSRFWHLLTDEQAPMFGVFDGYELQLLKDWILNDANKTSTMNRFRIRATGSTIESSAAPQSDASIKQIIAHHANMEPRTSNCAEVDILFRQLAGVDTKAGAFAVLTGMLSPANHPTPAGLAATRLYADLFLNLS